MWRNYLRNFKIRNLKEIGRRIWADIRQYGVVFIIFLVYYGIVHLFRIAFCPMIQITGLPCAGCGLTRAFLFILTGQFARAVYINPMAFPVILFLLYCGYFRYLKGTKIKGFQICFTVLIVIMLLFYVVRMVLYFPDRVPYVYTGGNVLEGRVPGYAELIEKLAGFLQRIRA